MTRSIRLAALVAAGLALAACTSTPEHRPGRPVDLGSLAAIRLVGYDSCAQALTELRGKLGARVGPYGLGGTGTDLAAPPGMPADAAGGDRAAAPQAGEAGLAQDDRASQPPPGLSPEHSTTNVQEVGVDEPDLVKTDGRRIVSIVDGTLRVIDVASRKITGTLPLSSQNLPVPMGGEADLLLSGDRALVIPQQLFGIAADGLKPPPPMPDRPNESPGMPVPPQSPGQPPATAPIEPPIEPPLTGPELILVDLSGAPKELGRFAIDGRYVDARMVGDTVRVVVSSTPRLNLVMPAGPGDESNALRRNQEIVANAGIGDWLPRYRTSTEHGTSQGRVDCSALSHPTEYSASAMLTVLSFDLTAASLGTGDPVTIMADGDIVYGTADSLYVGNQAGQLVDAGGPVPVPATELYKFDIGAAGKPRHVASGAVPGHLLNQYSLSEFDGRLRVATTTQDGQTSSSTVYVLQPRGDRLDVAGQVGGLGKGEQIYAVRFVGPVGYVVTFRQTDPLYTLDLRDPAAPKVVGELKITGYSAYLHPAGENRIIGIGQEATEQGRTTGTQVSVFDVSDPARPNRVAQYQVPGGHSEAEYDPHAFLYWAKTSTLVVPTAVYRDFPRTGALVLRLDDAALTEIGQVQHPDEGDVLTGAIRRSMVVGDELWTLSQSGLAANDLGTLDQRGWVGF